MVLTRIVCLRIFGVVPAIILLTMAMVPCLSFGQDYPAKTIQLILPQPPGGTGPIMGSLLAEEAKKYFKTPMIIVHKVGAGGTIGASFVAHSAPDGYTLLMARPAHISAAPQVQKVDYSPFDFEPMGQILTSPLTLLVRADAPWKTLKDFVTYAKENPGVVTCGNSGTYTSLHFHALRFEKVAGIKLTHVPFVGGANAVTALAGGHVSSVTRFPGEGEALIEAGKVRILAVFDSKRCKFYPNVPTSKEEGYPMEAVGWATLMGPKGTPQSIIRFWENMIEKITRDPGFIDKAEKIKMNIEYKSAEDFKKHLQKEVQDFSAVVKDLGLKPM